MKLLRFPFYPWLVGAYPVLYLYSGNFGLVIDREVANCLIWVLAATTIGYFAAFVVKRDYHIPALIVTVVSVCFSMSGHVHSLFANVPILAWTSFVSIVVAIAVAKMLRIRKHDSVEQLALPLNLISIAMTLIQLATLFILISSVNTSPVLTLMHDDMPSQKESSPKIKDSKTRPDIYYIIPDAYPSDSWLQSKMDYDNSAFTDMLKARGFVIATNAQSNYGATLSSMASILNMSEFNSNPSDLDDVDYLRYAIANNDVARFLKQQDYIYVQYLSGHLFPSPLADINQDFAPGGPVDISIEDNALTVALTDGELPAGIETDIRRFTQRSFLTMYIETTLLRIIADQFQFQLQGEHSWSYDKYSPRRFLDTIDAVGSIVAMPEATFSLIHLLKPHRPVTFDTDGNIIEMNKKPNRAEHLAEFAFVNSKFIELIDTILAGSQHQPVIIFQADHGSTDGKIRGGGYRLIHFDMYAAFYLPDQYALDLPQPYTTINTFPLILNALFNTRLEFRDNRLYELTSKSSRNPFELIDVTEDYANWLN